MDFFFQQFAFYLTIPIVFFAPGYFLMLAIFGKKYLSSLEKFAFAFSSSIIIVNFLMIFVGRFAIPINRASLLLSITIFSEICYFIYHKKARIPIEENKIANNTFSKKELFAILAILSLTIFIKTIYLSNAILPTSTDLGHHMYWTKTIVTSGQIPQYQEFDITENSTISEPQPIADFIIGEHLVFAATSIISGIDVVSYFPVLVLYLIHIMGIITLFILSLLIFKNSAQKNLVGIMTLFFAGPIYALSSPQMKFVSGGVIGNTIGNLLIPFTIYFFVRALSEKDSKKLAYTIFAGLGLAYTHHLSTFVFVFITIFTIALFAIFTLANKNHFKEMLACIQQWGKIIWRLEILCIIIFAVAFIAFFYTPTYLNFKAVDTAVGAPSKATRTGLTFEQLKFTAGEARMILGLIGIFMLMLVTKRRKEYGIIFLLGWSMAIAIMSLRPNWLFIDIPSNRIASYIVFPMTILASYAFVMIISAIKNSQRQHISNSFSITIIFMLLAFFTIGGFYDNSKTLNLDSSPKSTLQTYAASKYLAEKSNDSEMIIKDHNYLAADAWIKTFFMRGYNYPLSRAYFKRYEDPIKQREQCTLLMISTPSLPEAQKCFVGTNTNFLMINPKYDAAQFQKSSEFWQIYSADDVSIFYKKS